MRAARSLSASSSSRACAPRRAFATGEVLLARALPKRSDDDGAATKAALPVVVTAAVAAAATLLGAPGPAFAAKAAKAAKAASPAAALVGGGSAALGGLLFLPAWTPLHVGLLALASLNLLAGFLEGSGQNTPYSKFSPTQAAAAAAADEGAATTTTAAGGAAASGPAEARAWIAAWEQRENGAGTAEAAPPAPSADDAADDAPAPSSSAPAPAAAAVVSSRTGMAIIYAGGLLAAALAPLALPAAFAAPQLSGLPLADLLPAVLAPAVRPWLVALLLSAHFAKRELEVFFLHRYSGGIPVPTAAMISAVYTVTSLQYLYFTREASSSGFYAAASARAPDVGALGVLLFCVGQAGNFVHHKLLADLRVVAGAGGGTDGGGTSSGKKEAYAIPRGGLFGLVASPHYLFEIVAWLGLALATQTVVPLVACAGMASYLAGRSASTARWNEANLPGYPRERKRLVPFVW